LRGEERERERDRVEQSERVRDRKGIEKGSELQVPENVCSVGGEDLKVANRQSKRTRDVDPE
jgi:hypothetical protein